MTIDEAIAFCNEKSKNIKLKTEPETFEYISSLLIELKELRSMVKSTAFKDGYKQGRADAIDECIAELGNDYWKIAKLERLKGKQNE